MADSNVAITAGSGTLVDTRTVGTEHRQVVVLGDPVTNTDVATVTAAGGLSVNVTNASLTVASHAVTNAGTFAVQVTSAPSTAVTNAGTFVVQENGAALTALQLIDDTITAQGTALGTTKTSLMGASVTTSAPTYTTGQISPLSMDTSGALRVTGAGGGTQYTEDAAAATDPVGNMMMAVRRDTLSTSEVSADGDNIALKATNKGKLHVAAEIRMGDTAADVGSGTGGSATQRVIVDSAQIGSLGQATLAASVPVAPASNWMPVGAAVPGSAPYQGAQALTALPTAATAGNLVGVSADKFGRIITQPITVRDLTGTQTTTISASTSETTIVTAAASVFNDLVMLIVSNTSASTNTRIDFRDTTAGTVLFSLQSNGGQPPVGFCPSVAIPQTSVNTNWTAQCATSTTDVRIYAVFAKNR